MSFIPPFLFPNMRAGSDWSTIYLLVVAIVAALLIFGVVKPSMAKGYRVVK